MAGHQDGQHGTFTLIGLGDPVMDVVAHVEHAWLQAMVPEPGGCIAVTAEEMAALVEKASQQCELRRIPGGSAANVMKGLANISGGSMGCNFVGMLGADATGEQYRQQLRAQGVHPLLLESSSASPSATCLCLVTPDGQRTMRTCLGASLELTAASQLPASWAAGAKLLHCEGYCLYRPQLTQAAMEVARKAGALVSLDLASFELVRNCRSALQRLLGLGLVDVVFCNEDEAEALVGEVAADTQPGDWGADTCNGSGGNDSAKAASDPVAAAQEWVLRYAQLCVVSMGARGCVARARGGETGSSPAGGVRVVDTIGAGDHFASGFLYAYLQGCSLDQCAAAGCAAGSEAVQASGAELSQDAWERLRAKVASIVGGGGSRSAQANGSSATAASKVAAAVVTAEPQAAGAGLVFATASC